MKLVWFFVGCLGLVLGVAGVFLPLLPATPFLLIAAYGFARSSPRIHTWLIEHPYLGALIENWRKHGAIGRRDKALAGIAMLATFGLSLWAGVSAAYLAIQALALCGAAAFVFSRPEPP
jgi:uncharacterized protein